MVEIGKKYKLNLPLFKEWHIKNGHDPLNHFSSTAIENMVSGIKVIRIEYCSISGLGTISVRFETESVIDSGGIFHERSLDFFIEIKKFTTEELEI